MQYKQLTVRVLGISTISGKPVNKVLELNVDMERYALLTDERSVKKRLQDDILASGEFAPDDLFKLRYSPDEVVREWGKLRAAIRDAKRDEQARLHNIEGRITADEVHSLQDGEIFVFGSNAQGMHGAGAARAAWKHYGAIWGNGHGLQGRSYAIDSMSGLPELQAEAERFVQFAGEHPEMHFLLTRIGCGIAGFTDQQVAPLFAACREMSNVSLPMSFWNVIGMPEPKFDLERFVEAQSYAVGGYPEALGQMQEGRKTSDWIWYIFPQQKGLGESEMSRKYGLDGVEEARAYLEHPILGPRLREITAAVLSWAGKRSAEQLMGKPIDAKKLRSSMQIFDQVSPDDIFRQVLNAFFPEEK